MTTVPPSTSTSVSSGVAVIVLGSDRTSGSRSSSAGRSSGACSSQTMLDSSGVLARRISSTSPVISPSAISSIASSVASSRRIDRGRSRCDSTISISSTSTCCPADRSL